MAAAVAHMNCVAGRLHPHCVHDCSIRSLALGVFVYMSLFINISIYRTASSTPSYRSRISSHSRHICLYRVVPASGRLLETSTARRRLLFSGGLALYLACSNSALLTVHDCHLALPAFSRCENPLTVSPVLSPRLCLLLTHSSILSSPLISVTRWVRTSRFTTCALFSLQSFAGSSRHIPVATCAPFSLQSSAGSSLLGPPVTFPVPVATCAPLSRSRVRLSSVRARPRGWRRP